MADSVSLASHWILDGAHACACGMPDAGPVFSLVTIGYRCVMAISEIVPHHVIWLVSTFIQGIFRRGVRLLLLGWSIFTQVRVKLSRNARVLHQGVLVPTMSASRSISSSARTKASMTFRLLGMMKLPGGWTWCTISIWPSWWLLCSSRLVPQVLLCLIAVPIGVPFLSSGPCPMVMSVGGRYRGVCPVSWWATAPTFIGTLSKVLFGCSEVCFSIFQGSGDTSYLYSTSIQSVWLSCSSRARATTSAWVNPWPFERCPVKIKHSPGW